LCLGSIFFLSSLCILVTGFLFDLGFLVLVFFPLDSLHILQVALLVCFSFKLSGLSDIT
jgi:hypothetical protein